MTLARRNLVASCALLVALTFSQIMAQKELCKLGYTFANDLENCHHYYACVGPIPVSMTCPDDLLFSLSEKSCVYRDEIKAEDCLNLGGHTLDQSLSAPVPDGVREDANEVEINTEESRDERVIDSNQNGGSIQDADANEENGKGENRVEDQQRGKYKQKVADAILSPSHDGGMGPETDEYEKSEVLKENPKINSIAIDQRCHGDASIVPHETLCHRYFNCSNPHMEGVNRYLSPYEHECPYPQLFSLSTLQCEEFDTVDCGDRMEYLDPCEYSENICSGPNCAPCTVDHASCVGYPDGLMYWPGREGSGFFVECRNQRTISQGNCGMDERGMMRVFSSKMKKCVSYSEIIDEVCYWTSNTLPHPSECHLYYDCTMHSEEKPEGMNSMSYLKSCPYPKLYSVRTGQCEDFVNVNCGARREPKRPCDYMECVDPAYGSCEGLPDGPNDFRMREGTAHYVICNNERTVEKKLCPQDSRGLYMEFAPVLRRCIPRYM